MCRAGSTVGTRENPLRVRAAAVTEEEEKKKVFRVETFFLVLFCDVCPKNNSPASIPATTQSLSRRREGELFFFFRLGKPSGWRPRATLRSQVKGRTLSRVSVGGLVSESDHFVHDDILTFHLKRREGPGLRLRLAQIK